MSAPDPQGIRDAVLAMPEHLRDALWRIETARLHPMEAPAAFVCGMGGSAIGGDLAAAALGDRLSKPLLTVRGYELPSWAPAGSAVLCSSYSGDTEETLACYAAAEALGAQRLVATTGGKLAEAARRDDVPVIGLPGLVPQPRAAVGYMFCVAAELAVLALAAPRIATEIDAAAAQLSERTEALIARAQELAEQVGDAVPVIYGSRPDGGGRLPLEDAGEREREDAGLLRRLPEADHNELAGWTRAKQDAGPFALILLERPRPAPARAEADRAHRRGDRATAPRSCCRAEAEGETRDRARAGAGHARRPALARARGAPRGRPRPDRGDRGAEAEDGLT